MRWTSTWLPHHLQWWNESERVRGPLKLNGRLVGLPLPFHCPPRLGPCSTCLLLVCHSCLSVWSCRFLIAQPYFVPIYLLLPRYHFPRSKTLARSCQPPNHYRVCPFSRRPLALRLFDSLHTRPSRPYTTDAPISAPHSHPSSYCPSAA